MMRLWIHRLRAANDDEADDEAIRQALEEVRESLDAAVRRAHEVSAEVMKSPRGRHNGGH